LRSRLTDGFQCFLDADVYFDHYIPIVRNHLEALYTQNNGQPSRREVYHHEGISLLRAMISQMQPEPRHDEHLDPALEASIDNLLQYMAPSVGDFDFSSVSTDYSHNGPTITYDSSYPHLDIPHRSHSMIGTPEPHAGSGSSSEPARSPSPTPQPTTATSAAAAAAFGGKTESNSCCTLCGYRPKGDPRWFGGSMAKHMKLQHAATPPKIYRCPYPGCTSQFQKRPDNLRQHQLEKGHFVDRAGEGSKRPKKRKKMD
jgi:hypothetical protein